MEAGWTDRHAQDLAARIQKTLALMHRWGYAPRLDVLAEQLLGGPADRAEVQAVVGTDAQFATRGGFACLRGSESLLQKSKDRIEANRRMAEEAWGIARDYARDLVRTCPFVESVALSGSLASGGYSPKDDIDFDLIVQPGAKYIAYLVAHLVGLKYSFRFRHRRLDDFHHTPLFPKITCINVVWTQDQIRPFVRRDENMAFELFRCVPILGIPAFEEALRENGWVREYFPQAFDRIFPEETLRKRSLVGHILAGVGRSPKMLAFVERLSRRIGWRLYNGVQSSRKRNPAAVARMAFLRRAKYPYEVFQD